MSENIIIIMVLAFFLPFSINAANDEIIFATAPTHSAEITQKIYTPMLNFLSHKTGKKFTLEVPSSFIQYSSHMQAGKYDMVFDGPHLSGWRMDRQQHTPVVKFPGKIKIVMAAKGLKIIAKPPGGYPERTFTIGPLIHNFVARLLSYY